jgi:2-polyprenyl-3-methyl-5-hydroxy-6-metoxy-1,4-benzoquinol methylase
MPEAVGGLRGLLAAPVLYDALQVAVGSNRSHQRFVAEYIRPRAGERVLDLGCGPGRVLRALRPDVEYVGVDSNEDYVEAARQTWGDRGRFERVDVRDAALRLGTFDVVMTMGVLHHLDDSGCSAMLSLAARSLVPHGRFVAIEPAYADDQSRVARWLIARDRGAHVRSVDAYGRLAERAFRSVRVARRDDLLRVPYTHAIVEATASLAG